MRNGTLDVLRGVAIALMVLDHVAVVYELPGVVRDVARLALPLFMVTSGYLFNGRLGSRYQDVIIAAVFSWPLVVLLDLALVHILMVYALVVPLLCAPLGWVVAFAGLGLLQAANWPIMWGGYQPGYVLAFLVIGRLARESGVTIRDFQFPSVLTLVGRYPLTCYGGHLAVLFGLSAV